MSSSAQGLILLTAIGAAFASGVGYQGESYGHGHKHVYHGKYGGKTNYTFKKYPSPKKKKRNRMRVIIFY